MSFLWMSFLLSKVSKRNIGKRYEILQSQQYKHQIDVIDVVLVLLLLTLNMFHTFL